MILEININNITLEDYELNIFKDLLIGIIKKLKNFRSDDKKEIIEVIINCSNVNEIKLQISLLEHQTDVKFNFEENLKIFYNNYIILDNESLSILKNEKLLNLLCDEAQKKITEERNTIKTILLCANGRNVINHNTASYNLLISSDSGAGKDYVVTNTLNIMPENEYVKRTRITSTVFTYWHNPKFEPTFTWNKKVFYCEDISDNVLNSDVFKVMCSTGSYATVVIKQNVHDIEIKGKPVIIITTAKGNLTKELMRRFSIIDLDETKAQTEAIMQRISLLQSTNYNCDIDEKIKKSLIFLKRVKVIIPFADKLIKSFPKEHIIMRTHFSRFLDFIKSSASLYQYQRKKDENNCIIAQWEDYDIAREVLLKMTSNSFMIPLTQTQKKILEVFKELKYKNIVITKFKCPECNIIYETNECLKCFKYDDFGRKIKYNCIDYNLEKFTIYDILPYLTFFTDSERWLKKQIDVLSSYNFLTKDNEKRGESNRPYLVYSYNGIATIDIPTSYEILGILL